MYCFTTQSTVDFESDESDEKDDDGLPQFAIILATILGGVPALVCACIIIKTAISSCQKEPISADNKTNGRLRNLKHPRSNRTIIAQSRLKPDDAQTPNANVMTSTESVRTHSTHISSDRSPHMTPQTGPKHRVENRTIASRRSSQNVDTDVSVDENVTIAYNENELESANHVRASENKQHSKRKLKKKRLRRQAFENTGKTEVQETS